MSAFRDMLLNQAFYSFDYNLGNAAMVLGNYDEAQFIYLRGLNRFPDHSAIMYNLADVLDAKSRREEAASLRHRALEINPDVLALCAYDLGETLMIQGRQNEAAERFRTVLAHNPDHGDARYRLARLLWCCAAKSEALQIIFESEALPQECFAPNQLVNLLGMVAAESSEAELNRLSARALAAAPSSFPTRLKVARAGYRFGWFDRAIALLLKTDVVKGEDDYYDCNLELASLWIMRGQFGNALPALQKLFDVYHDFETSRARTVALRMASCQLAVGQLAAAEKLSSALLTRDPKFGEARFQLGSLRMAEDRIADAAVEFQRGFVDGDLTCGVFLGLTRVMAGEFALAQGVLAQLRSGGEDAPWIDCLSGILCLHQGDPQKAESLFASVVAKDPTTPMFASWLGLAFHAQGRIDQALEVHRRAIVSVPYSPWERINLSLALQADGRLEEALAIRHEVQRSLPGNYRQQQRWRPLWAQAMMRESE
ncbi:hypothetical protein WCLP8_3030003 [uncultured Gammaproteobacteria bacterium]